MRGCGQAGDQSRDAVALEDNLIVPVVRDADRLSITGLATTMADLGRGRAATTSSSTRSGGTFTLTTPARSVR